MNDEVEVMRIIRVPPRGELVVQVGKSRVKHLQEIPSSATARQRVLAAVGELVTFVGGYQILVDAGLAPPVHPPPAPVVKPEPPLNAQQEEFLRSLKNPEQTSSTGQATLSNLPPLQPTPTYIQTPPSTSPVPASPPPSTRPMSANATIAEQVNPILKKHLAAHPEMAGTYIELHTDGAGALLIEVNGQYYENPRQIDDKQVRQIIKAALREWDSR